MTPTLFSELGLSAELLKAIDKLGYEKASPIQAAAIPPMMKGLDIVGQSQTGSGKTAAFAIPAIEHTDPQIKAVQTLILCPTRELAVQVAEEIHKLTLFKRGISSLPIYGGQSYERQFYGLKQGAQIVIGTPGRTMDHMRRGTLRFDQLKTVILDEADVMLDMGFREDIETILKSAPASRQTVFFSATMSPTIQRLIQTFSKDPLNVKIEQKALTVPTVEQVYYEVDRRFKVDLLTRLIDIHDLKLGIIFCNTKRMVDDLVEHLEAQGYMADRLHGDMNQNQRDRVMNRFRKSGLEFLVATDVAARGIDVDDIEVVFNYDLPYDAEDYVHRIGRTGRAGRSGRAISFVSGREFFQIRNIERYTNTRVHRGQVPTQDDVDEARNSNVLKKLRATLQAGEFRRQDHLIERLLEEGFPSTDIASALLHQMQDGDNAPSNKSPQPSRPASTPDRDQREPRRDRQPMDDSRPARNPSPRDERPAIPRDVRAASLSRPPAPIQKSVEPRVTVTPIAAKPKVERPAPTAKPSMKPKVEAPAKPPAPKPVAQIETPTPAPKPVAPVEKPESRAPGSDQVRLHMNIGEAMGVTVQEVTMAILGETGLPEKTVGKVDLRERHLFVDVKSEHAKAIIAKINRTRIHGNRVKVKEA
jgi:ATP-dependent RNA helicase DeaD